MGEKPKPISIKNLDGVRNGQVKPKPTTLKTQVLAPPPPVNKTEPKKP